MNFGKQLLPGEDGDSKKDGLPEEEICQFVRCHEGVDVDQGDLRDIQAGGGDHGDGGRAQAVEGVLDMFAVLELLQEGGDDQDDDQGGRRQGQGRDNTAGIAPRLEAGIGRHVDADRAGRGLGDGDHIRDVRVGEPVRPVGHLIEEGERRESAADGKESCLEKIDKELKIDHTCSPDDYCLSRRAPRITPRAPEQMTRTAAGTARGRTPDSAVIRKTTR